MKCSQQKLSSSHIGCLINKKETEVYFSIRALQMSLYSFHQSLDQFYKTTNLTIERESSSKIIRTNESEIWGIVK